MNLEPSRMCTIRTASNPINRAHSARKDGALNARGCRFPMQRECARDANFQTTAVAWLQRRTST